MNWLRFNKLIFLLSVSTSYLSFYSYSQDFKKEIFTVKDGLPSSYILNVYQDDFGFLWVGTIGGLSRYDGREFINYGLAEGLPSPAVDAIFMDSQKRLWVGTRKGIARLQGNKFIQYKT